MRRTLHNMSCGWCAEDLTACNTCERGNVRQIWWAAAFSLAVICSAIVVTQTRREKEQETSGRGLDISPKLLKELTGSWYMGDAPFISGSDWNMTINSNQTLTVQW